MERVRYLAWAIHPRRSKLKLMLGLAAYFDESGHSVDPACRFVGMGGLIAPESAWTSFDERWRGILDDQNDGECFHMNVFSANTGKYASWGKERRKRLLGDLVGAIVDSGAKPFGAVVSLDGYKRICDIFPGVGSILHDPYYICFQDVSSAAAISVISYAGNVSTVEEIIQFEQTEKVAMVYARQNEFGAISSPEGVRRENMGRAESLWYELRDRNPQIGKWMGSYSSGEPEQLSFLQAADLFSYELIHDFENRLNRPNDPMRWGLSTLLPGNWRNLLFKVYGFPQLLELLLEGNLINLTEEQAIALSTNSSLSRIANRDILFSRMDDRRNRDENPSK